MNNKKIIALLPFKNEEWILPTYLKNVSLLADKIIAIDDGSTDNGRKVLEKNNKVVVYDNTFPPDSSWAEFSIREKLLELARAEGGTHFICLDADEALSTNFLKVAHRVLEQLEPGQKLAMQWLPMWKSVSHYRDDNSIWSSIWKDFIIRDGNNVKYSYAEFGVSRTPGKNIEDDWLKLKQKHGVCMHFSFTKWERFQYKSCWYRCFELASHPAWIHAINEKYKITLDSKSILRKLPDEWIEGIPMPDLDTSDNGFHLEKIEDLFKKYGAEYFNQLHIWHMPEIQKLGKKYGR